MNTASAIFLILTLVAVSGALFLGLISMAKGGEFNKKYGNKFMQARVYLQGIALVFIVITFYLSQT